MGCCDEFDCVIGIDFGTTYSGWAYAHRNQYGKGKMDIRINKWTGNKVNQYLSIKAPSVVLFDKELNFHSFGYRAMNAYTTEMENGNTEWHLLKHFKMTLHEAKYDSPNDTFKIKDEKGYLVEALLVFTECIKYLKEEADKEVELRLGTIKDSKVRYVLTVPAIWLESSKKFMRKAAEQAGIRCEQLVLALEPEAAALYCKQLYLNTALGQSDVTIQNSIKEGGKYMVLDLGGGTVDTVVHGVDESGETVELYKSSGGPWGGNNVNEQFREFIKKTYGHDALVNFMSKRPRDFQEMEMEFETQKRQLTGDKDSRNIRLKMPARLKQFADVVVNDHTLDHLYIERENFQSFFDPLTKEIVKHIESVEKIIGKVRVIYMVGGFADSHYAQSAIRSAFESATGKKIVVPEEAGTAVMRGAVMFGFDPTAIKSRITRFSYGVDVLNTFIDGEHPLEKLVVVDDENHCKDIFRSLVVEGEKVAFDETHEIKLSSTHRSSARKNINIIFPIVLSKTKYPKYTTDEGCEVLGTLTVGPPKNGWPDLNEYNLVANFGQTELNVTVRDNTKQRVYHSTFEMLQ